MAWDGFIFFNLFIGTFKKGPPEAVIIISSTSSLLTPFVSFIIEKCSESTGTISVLYFLISLFKIGHPHIIVSLFAKATFLLILMASIVGCNPANPTTADIV